MTSGTTGLVLLPGAGLGAWIWRDVLPLLDGPALAVEYPGRGAPRVPGRTLGLGDYAAHVHEQITAWGVPSVVLVAHSLGGVVALRVSKHLGPRLVGFVGIAAAIPPNRGSFLSCLPFPKRLVLRVVIRVAGTRPPDDAIRAGLAGGLDPSVATEVVERFTPESPGVYSEAVDVFPPRIPRLYVKCAADREIDPDLQTSMASNLGATAIATVEAGHLPMLARPAEIAAILNEFVMNPPRHPSIG